MTSEGRRMMMMSEGDRDRLLEAVTTDLKNISLESRKKFPSVKESAEEAIVKIRTLPGSEIYQISNSILLTLVTACETREVKIVRSSLSLTQRLILSKALDPKGGSLVSGILWNLMEAGVEEIKILQTLTLLVTSSKVLKGDSLSKGLVLAFRLHFTKDPSINVLAGATVRQLIPAVFERVKENDEKLPERDPKNQFAVDAYKMFQDLALLVSGEQPLWLLGIVEMTRTFGLELLESLLSQFPEVFSKRDEFKFLLKDKICSLVIKLFSPSTKIKFNLSDKPNFPITSKLLRVVSVLVLEYHDVLTTETEIFLSLTTKFLDPDKPSWQNCIALEVIHKILVKTDLIAFVCKHFDLKEHSTNVFQDIINGLGAYVQNVMLTPVSSSDVDFNSVSSPQTGVNSAVHNGGNSILYGGGPGLSPQPGFYYRSVWKPLTMSFIGGQTKEIYLEMTEKLEPPVVSEGYGISLAYICLLDAVRSLSLLIRGSGSDETSDEQKAPILEDKSVCKRLIDSSWCGVLASLSLLLDASTDDASTENILKHIQTYASIAGLLGLTKARDAFLAAICKASLPPHYTLTVLKSTASTQTVSGPRVHNTNESNSHIPGDNDLRHQVVAVGTPLPTASLPASAHQGPVMLTSKNLQCMRAILSVAHCHGNLLGSSWHIILTSLQHLVWILGLKPVTGGGVLTSSPTNSSTTGNVENNSSVITTAVMADLPVLSNMVTRLFESSCDLSDDSVKYLIEALCILSDECMELASTNREPSLFAVAKLLETALVNLSRLEIIWRPITNHLLAVCQHPHLRMRQWGCEALTFLSKQSLQQDYDPPLSSSSRLQTLLLSPLSELCVIPYPDVRQKQLDTVMHILHASGESLSDGWPVLLNIIGSLEVGHSDILVRNAFQCIQLIFTDFLPVLPYRCYPICVETAAKFGSQTAELNVSLTAIGLLWNLSDYFFQNVNSSQLDNSSSVQVGGHSIFPDFPGCKNMPSFDKLWMCLYCKLKDLCLDKRPSVRKSAGQTLFSTIAAHGSILQSNTWQAVLWQVLFPLLDSVIIQSDCASTERESEAIMIHHSRNTAQKQWAETKVLTISGVVRVFNTKRTLLKSLGDYSKAWVVLLEFVEKVALSETMEVSLAALNALHEMVSIYENKIPAKEIDWPLCWKAWVNIGSVKAKYIELIGDSSVHSTVLLTGLMQIFLSLFPHLKASFSSLDIEKLGTVLLLCLRVPVDGESDLLTSVHKTTLDVMKIVKSHCIEKDFRSNIPELFEVFFKFVGYAFSAPLNAEKPDGCNGSNSKSLSRFHERLSMFGGIVAKLISEFYEETCAEPCVLEAKILYKVILVLGKPLRRKYECFRDNDWRVSITVLLSILKRGIPLARCETDKSYDTFWTELGDILEAFLFPKEIETDKDRSADEAVDCELVELLRTQVLPYPVSVPEFFIRKMVVLLNRGSIHTSVKFNRENSIGFREDFAQHCFETLLEFSLLETDDTVDLTSVGTASSSSSVSSASVSPCRESSLTNKLAILTLLVRFRDVLMEATEDDKLYQNMPLPRTKIAEITFVLKAIATVISSAKKTNKVNKKTWKQILGLYPLLVRCTGCASTQISEAVKLALMEYNDLLKPF